MKKNYSIPVYLQIVDRFKRRLTSGDFTPNQLLPKEADFAREFGVTRTTLRHAFAVLEREGFILRKRSSGTVVAPTAMHNKHLHAELAIVRHYEERNKETYSMMFERREDLGLLIRLAAERGMILRFIPLNNDKPFFDASDLIFRKGIDGFIVSSPTYVRNFVDMLADNRIPHVLLETHYERRGTNSVVNDEESVAFELIQTLYRHGHRKIGYCGGLLKQPEINSLTRRYLELFDKFRRQFGMVARDGWVVNIGAEAYDNISIDYRKLAAALLDCNEKPTAVFCPCTRSARGFIAEAQARGIGIPSDISLVCGNTRDKLDDFLDGVVGFGHNHELFSRSGLEMLLEWIRDPRYRPTCRKIPMIRESGQTIATPRHRKDIRGTRKWKNSYFYEKGVQYVPALLRGQVEAVE